jgi:hypothetical protein
VAAPAGTAPLEAVVVGPPVARAVAADALGRAPAAAAARPVRVAALLDVMARDGIPAVRLRAALGVAAGAPEPALVFKAPDADLEMGE